MQTPLDSLRLIPSDWTSPLDLEQVFHQTPVRLEVDIGCGKGRFLLERARAYPDTSFLGIDRLLSRVLKVEHKALRQGLFNIRLFYVDALYAVKYLLPPRSISTYYIFFPDPWPKRKHNRRRLFDQGFLDALANTIVGHGCIHIATDHMGYFEIIRGMFLNDSRFKEIPPFVVRKEEQTNFERVFLNLKKDIGRCSFEKNA